ncbi:MAG: lipocalin family protein [Desulfosarcinaceae bacterium]|nr:lipocalin family protein [Desulfosarcinaceae bacterium]
MKPITTVPHVDLDRFMGEWYVIASIPTIFEKGAHNGLEHYKLTDDGRVKITFTYNKDDFDGPTKQITSTGFIADGSGNALWGVQFIWPFKAEYRIVWLDDDYQLTVIGRSKRDYVWIMARTPVIPESDYSSILTFLEAEGYAIDKIQKVPHQSRPAA